MWYKFAQEQNDIQELINFFLNKYPEIVLRINEFENKIKLDKIFIPKEMRGMGIGTEIIFFSKLVGKFGKVYALEANPNVFKLLLKTIEINNLQNVIPINLAVYNISKKTIKSINRKKYEFIYKYFNVCHSLSFLS